MNFTDFLFYYNPVCFNCDRIAWTLAVGHLQRFYFPLWKIVLLWRLLLGCFRKPDSYISKFTGRFGFPDRTIISSQISRRIKTKMEIWVEYCILVSGWLDMGRIHIPQHFPCQHPALRPHLFKYYWEGFTQSKSAALVIKPRNRIPGISCDPVWVSTSTKCCTNTKNIHTFRKAEMFLGKRKLYIHRSINGSY